MLNKYVLWAGVLVMIICGFMIKNDSLVSNGVMLSWIAASCK